MNWKTTILLAVAIVISSSALTGCGALYRTRPHDLTVRDHEVAALADEARGHQAEEDARFVGRGALVSGPMAPRYRELAGSHRAAARALREEEVTACAGVPVAGSASALVAGADVVTVSELREVTAPLGRGISRGYYPEYLRGAKLVLHGEAGPADVERLLTCRIARAAADGDDGVDPIAVRGASFIVRKDDGQSLTVELRAPEQPAAAEVLRRARTLASR